MPSNSSLDDYLDTDNEEENEWTKRYFAFASFIRNLKCSSSKIILSVYYVVWIKPTQVASSQRAAVAPWFSSGWRPIYLRNWMLMENWECGSGIKAVSQIQLPFTPSTYLNTDLRKRSLDPTYSHWMNLKKVRQQIYPQPNPLNAE